MLSQLEKHQFLATSGRTRSRGPTRQSQTYAGAAPPGARHLNAATDSDAPGLPERATRLHNGASTTAPRHSASHRSRILSQPPLTCYLQAHGAGARAARPPTSGGEPDAGPGPEHLLLARPLIAGYKSQNRTAVPDSVHHPRASANST